MIRQRITDIHLQVIGTQSSLYQRVYYGPVNNKVRLLPAHARSISALSSRAIHITGK